jgi:hypothetical protein
MMFDDRRVLHQKESLITTRDEKPSSDKTQKSQHAATDAGWISLSTFRTAIPQVGVSVLVESHGTSAEANQVA